ncbi:ABC transporter ATP-binding protein [Actinomyces sp.]|uniref:ABC transporter ATP-binding protein n=1 Tax=Actinomyces sp. TaxID=29317 RepID=UPI0026DD4475|nr:ABC transporter ATP-binding protein [Actinomyces sp.]MDO4901291.1 ABC transporter ATP-binding protein [Actinomyces sp.]
MNTSTSATAAVPTQAGAAATDGAPASRGAGVSLAGVSHRYPLRRDVDHGWVPALMRLASPAARARHESEAAKPALLPVLDGIDLDIAPGEFVSLVGQSGCGKSTILRLLSGLEVPSGGSVIVDGEPVTGTAPERALAFQDATLLPWRTVRENVALGPQARGRVEPRRVEAALEVVGLRDFADAYPTTLSGGMAQRAALARALVNRPRLFLLDEPFGKLDALTRLTLQDEIASLWASQGFTAVLVTHDVEEALRLSNRVIVLSERPAHVVEDIRVPEGLGGDESAPEFQRLRRHILTLLGR